MIREAYITRVSGYHSARCLARSVRNGYHCKKALAEANAFLHQTVKKVSDTETPGWNDTLGNICSVVMPAGGLTFCVRRKSAKTHQGGGRFRISPPSLDLPLIKTGQGVLSLTILRAGRYLLRLSVRYSLRQRFFSVFQMAI